MQLKTIKVSNLNRDTTVSKHTLFDWELVKEEKHKFSTTLTFQRDDSVEYFDKLKLLEETYGSYNYIPFIFVIILTALAVSSFTTFLIMFFVNNKDISKAPYSIVFIVLGALCLLCSVIVLYLRTKTAEKISIEKPKKDREYKEKITALKQGEDK